MRIAAVLVLSACVPAASEIEPNTEDAVIVGEVDWREIGSLGDDTPERRASRAVGYLEVGARSSRCTAFLIAPDVVMTNHHCVPDAAAAVGATVYFRREAGVAVNDWQRYSCDQFLGNDAAMDFALLGCSGRPGQVLGVLGLDATDREAQTPLYLIHQNCDWFTDPSCEPSKKYSAGRLSSKWSSEWQHDADTLGGSSGSPVLDARTHRVIALHHAGGAADARGRGTSNWAVPMLRIVPALLQRFPNLDLGPKEALGLPTPDALEPNDAAADATPVREDWTSQLTIHPGDRDVFAVTLAQPGSLEVKLDFALAQGDLDVALFRGGIAGQPLLAANSPVEGETLNTGVLQPGTYFVVVYGYQNATNRYEISIKLQSAQDPGPSPVFDRFEPNDTFELAPVWAVPAMEEGVAISSTADVDYYAFDSDGGVREVTMDFAHGEGDLDLYLLDLQQKVWGESLTTTNQERLVLQLPAGRYWIKVVGYGGAMGRYRLALK